MSEWLFVFISWPLSFSPRAELVCAGDARLCDVEVQGLRLRNDDQLRGRVGSDRRPSRLPARQQDPPSVVQEVQTAGVHRLQRQQHHRPVEPGERGACRGHRQPVRPSPPTPRRPFYLLTFSHSTISYVRCLFSVLLYLCRFCVRTYVFINVVLIIANDELSCNKVSQLQ